MQYPFYKYQGAGNDFIVFDNRNGLLNVIDHQVVKNMCDRRIGIGADGLMLLESAEGFDFKMIYFNADGRAGSMCGNGGRCIAAFARHLGLFHRKADFLAVDGPHTAFSNDEGTIIKLSMQDVDAIQKEGDAWILNTGSPHYVKIVENLDEYPVVEEGRRVRYSDRFPEGINVNFVESLPTGGYRVRTYERGVEDETRACGTGATAVALAMAQVNGNSGLLQTDIHVPGGLLTIDFHSEIDRFTDIFLTGSALLVYEGKIDFLKFSNNSSLRWRSI